MMPTVLSSVRSLLNNDATLIEYLGINRVFLGWLTESMQIPCITISENNETSNQRPCYLIFKHRDNSPLVQIDLWVDRKGDGFPCTIEDVETIVSRVDALLFGTGVTNTRSWRRVSSSGPTEADNLFHKALRYEFAYSVSD